MAHTKIAFALAIVSLALSPLGVLAQDPLDLDSSFGVSGRVATNFGSDELAAAVVVQSDGRIVVAGSTFGKSSDLDFIVARYQAGGSLDSSFGTGGRVTTDLGGQDMAFAVAIQTDGKIVVAGGSDTITAQGARIGLARYDSNGVLDPSFGTGGIVLTDIETFDYAYGLALQTDGRILVVGQTFGSGSPDSDLVVVRYQTTGALDGSFGSGGVVKTDFGGREDIGRDIDVLADGRIVVAGSSWNPSFSPVYGVLARYQTGGNLDNSFDGDPLTPCALIDGCGRISTNLGGGSFDWINALAVRRPDGTEDGKIVVSGPFGVARYTADGALDFSFSGDGINESGTIDGWDVAIRNDGRVVRVGASGLDFGIELYDSNGQFGGKCSIIQAASVDFNAGADQADAVAIQQDGKIVLAGWGEVWDANDIELARYLGTCNPKAMFRKRYFVAYNKFVHPQDKVGPSWPGAVPPGLARSTQVVIPASETAAALPFAYKSYEYESQATRLQTAFPAAAMSSATAAEATKQVLATAIGEYPVVVGRQAYAMLPATVRSTEPRLQYPQSGETGGYRCNVAESPTAGRLTLEDPLSPGRRITTAQVTHVCSAWDPTERTAAEADLLLCFAAVGDRDSRHRVFVRDTLGSQMAELGAPAAICVEAVESENASRR